jgi:hypothetical protein
VWSAYGWTWVPYESWGWAPFHYGRWGYSGALGWYWIPGNVWGPAWVSWAVGGDYVGWCPLGHGDRPVVVDNRPREHAVPRGSLAVSNVQPWIYARKGDISARDLPRRRLEMRPSEIQNARVAESPTARPSRDFTRVTEAPVAPRERAVPRGGSLKPTIGDTVPELRYDPTTQIPITVPRRRLREGDDSRFDRAPARGTSDAGANRDAGEAGNALRERTRSRWSPPDEAGGSAAPTGEGRHPTDTRSPSRGSAATPRGNEERVRPGDPDRDVLRRMFRPLTEPRSGGQGQAVPQRSEPRTQPPPRPAPTRTQPPPAPPRPQTEHATPRPVKEKDK